MTPQEQSGLWRTWSRFPRLIFQGKLTNTDVEASLLWFEWGTVSLVVHNFSVAPFTAFGHYNGFQVLGIKLPHRDEQAILAELAGIIRQFQYKNPFQVNDWVQLLGSYSPNGNRLAKGTILAVSSIDNTLWGCPRYELLLPQEDGEFLRVGTLGQERCGAAPPLKFLRAIRLWNAAKAGT